MRRLLLGSDQGEIKTTDLECFAMIDLVHSWRKFCVRVGNSDFHSLRVFCRIEAFSSSLQLSTYPLGSTVFELTGTRSLRTIPLKRMI